MFLSDWKAEVSELVRQSHSGWPTDLIGCSEDCCLKEVGSKESLRESIFDAETRTWGSLPADLIEFYVKMNGLIIPGFGAIRSMDSIGLYRRLAPTSHGVLVGSKGAIMLDVNKSGQIEKAIPADIFAESILLTDDGGSQSRSILVSKDGDLYYYWFHHFHEPVIGRFDSFFKALQHVRAETIRTIEAILDLDE
jgi:hypothetical protein